MSLRTDDIEGARPKYFEKQKLIAQAKIINNGSNIFSPPNMNQQSIVMRNPDIYSSQVANQVEQQTPQQSMQQIDNQREQNPQVEGREKSMYQLEYSGQTPLILQNKSSVDYGRNIQRNPIYHYSPGQQQNGKMQSEKQYQEQLVLQEMQKFKERQLVIEQEKRRKELEYREQEIARKQQEQEYLRQMQQAQEERQRQNRQQEEDRRNQEREMQLKRQDELRQREQMLQDKEKMVQDREQQLQQQRASANASKKSQSQQFQMNQYKDDNALLNQIHHISQQSQPQLPLRVPSSGQSQAQIPQQNPNLMENNIVELRKTPVRQLDQLQASPPGNAKYFNTPLPSQYKKIDPEVIDNSSQIQQPNVKVSQLAAKSILSPMSAILQHNNNNDSQIANKQQPRPKQKPTRVLAIIDSDSRVREVINKFFNVRGVYEFEIFCLPGSGAGLINDKGWRDTFMSCFSFMRQQYDFTDIYVFTQVDSVMVPLWYEQNISNGQQADKIALKNYHVDVLKQSVATLQQNVSQSIKVSAFLFDNRGGSEKIV